MKFIDTSTFDFPEIGLSRRRIQSIVGDDDATSAEFRASSGTTTRPPSDLKHRRGRRRDLRRIQSIVGDDDATFPFKF